MIKQGPRSTVNIQGDWVYKYPVHPEELDQELRMLRFLQGWKHSPDLHPDYIKGSHTDICMKYLGGVTLDDFCQRENLNLKAFEEVMLLLSQAIKELEKMRLIHADLHPGNIIIDKEVYIIDYGWAYLVSEEPPWIQELNLPDNPKEVRENLLDLLPSMPYEYIVKAEDILI